ncbi:MAG: hypothetical protein HY303_03480 [Candidatus Wallbacteria bacterium]|nr:hypothetical protein [Candidatus Wallbacteria bacterium]
MKLSFGTVVAVLAWVAGLGAVQASHRVRLIGAGDERGFDTFRAISKVTRKTGPVFVERTQDGLKVGQLTADSSGFGRAERGATPQTDAEDRIVVVRPVFAESINAVRGWRVTQVTQRTFVQNTSLFRVLDTWGPASQPKEIYELKHESAAITPTSLADAFQRVLDGENNSSVTNGFYLQGTASLRVPSTQPLLFDVFLEAPLAQGRTPDSTSVHPLIPVTATAELKDLVIGNTGLGAPVTQRFNVLVFSSSLKGSATIFVQETAGTLRPIQSHLGVAPGVVYRAAIRNEALRSGANQVLVGVFDPNDPGLPDTQTARGFSTPVTMNNPP